LLRKIPRALSALPLISSHFFDIINHWRTNNRASHPSVKVICCDGGNEHREVITMLWTIFVILLVLWAVGLVSSYTLGGFIHILLVLALVVLLIQLIQGRRPVV
jgi:predicted ferric reductase